LTDFGGKTSIFSHPVYLFLREFSLQDFRGGSEHLEERRLMLQWWADFLDANRERFISPFEYAKINNPLKQ
ncbi:hypothetical protein, partial [Escherichia coli]|uniref:hypothetical protein n=1 Tax=Escherichia coli TaxID=562 RepID=UPI0030F407C1